MEDYKQKKKNERRIIMTQEQAQAIYDDGYKQGQDDMDARFRIGKVYANNENVRYIEAVKKLVEENPNLSDEYKRGKMETIDLYMKMELFNHDVDKLALRKTAEEQARIVRNRLEQRYREAIEEGRIDMTTYLQITTCIEAVYEELFFAGFNVGLGELIGPQKITLNNEEDNK